MSESKTFDKWKDKRENFIRFQCIQKPSGANGMTGEWRQRGHKYLPSTSCFPSFYNILFPPQPKSKPRGICGLLLFPPKKLRLTKAMSFRCSSFLYPEPNSNQIHATRLRITRKRNILAA